MKKDNIATVLIKYVEALSIPLSRQSIVKELQVHPEANSMLGISDILNNWKIPNVSYVLDFDRLTDVPSPFVAWLKTNEFVLIHLLGSKEVILSNHRWDHKRMPLEEFKKLYAGSVLYAEKDENSGEENHQ